MAFRKNTNGNTTDVLVIGAGIAGLTVSEGLQKANIDHIVLEARSHVGGRIESAPAWLGKKKAALPLGAGFVHCAWRLKHDPARWALPTFRYSIAYLGLLFAALLLDHHLA